MPLAAETNRIVNGSLRLLLCWVPVQHCSSGLTGIPSGVWEGH